MHYPLIDPVIVAIGPLAIRWYGVSYLAAFTLAWWLGTRRAGRDGWSKQELSDVIFYGAVGAVLGGRIGYALFYGFESLKDNPLWLFRIWEGGMSFHGGILGVFVSGLWFVRKTGRRILDACDFVVPLVPTGLGLGRLGNFINMELPGRATDSIFGLVYPCSAEAVRSIDMLCTGVWEDFARHPSPLYQAFAEGIVLFVFMWWFSATKRAAGVVTGAFLIGYGVLRCATELFREPDAHLGFIALDWVTMGQILSLPMILLGIAIIVAGRRRAA